MIDKTFPEHPYLQLAARLREQIMSGAIASQVPSITTLTAEESLAAGTEVARVSSAHRWRQAAGNSACTSARSSRTPVSHTGAGTAWEECALRRSFRHHWLTNDHAARSDNVY